LEHKHHKKLKLIVILVFILLALGEVLLYRRTLELNKMVSEGLMQLKEAQKTPQTTTPTGIKQ